jgi:hypothetical protein
MTADPATSRQSQNAMSVPPATFTEGWTPVDERREAAAIRDNAVEQASGEMEQTRRREHSLLVPSQ